MAVAEVAERRSQVGCLNAKSVGERLGCKLQQGDITLCIILYVIPHILQALLKFFLYLIIKSFLTFEVHIMSYRSPTKITDTSH